MKRALELDEVADDLIKVANTTDEKGNPVYPIAEDPLLILIFQSRYALIEELKTKPIRLLNLMRTNKTMNEIFSKVESIWSTLIDYFVESQASAYYAEIYPFFLVQNHVANDGDYGPTRLYRIMGEYSMKDKRMAPVPQLYLHSHGDILKPNVPYYLVHYDDFTKRFVDLLQRIRDLRRWVRMDGYGMRPYEHLIEYTGKDVDFIAYHDYFLVDRAEPIIYNVDALFKLLPFIVSVTSKFSVDPSEANYTPNTRDVKIIGNHPTDSSGYASPSKTDEFKEMQAKAIKLEEWIRRPEFAVYRRDVLEMPVKPILLDKNMALSYRTTAFDKKIGLYNTAEKQKELYRQMFDAALPGKYNPERRKEFIETYGENTPLQCVVCQEETFNVDLAKSMAFCSIKCHSTLTL